MLSDAEPKPLEPFTWAVIRLATYVRDSSAAPRLLFGTVSLLTDDRPRPASGYGVERHRVAKGKGGTVYFQRTVLEARAAVEWYRSAAANGIVTPVPSDPKEVDATHDGTPLAPSVFADDPEWPALGLPAGSDLMQRPAGPGDPAPFLGSASASARIHRRFGDNGGFETVTADAETVAFLLRRVHVDLADYTEYLGSLVLVVPDPILRGVHHYFVSEDDKRFERLIYRLLPRSGQTLDGLSLTILEQRANLLSRFETVPVPEDGLVISSRQLPVQSSGYVVTHPLHGVLAYQAPVPFLRTVSISMGIVGRRVKVEVPEADASGAPMTSYNVAEVEHEHPIVVGDDVLPADLARVFEAEERRERRALARRYDQTWFDSGMRSEAIEFVRSRVAQARFDVLVADPYFGGTQVLQFLHAVHRINVRFTILTSRLAFESEVLPSPALRTGRTGVQPVALNRRDAERTRLEAFAAATATFERRGIKNAETLVLMGKVPPLHDRLLMIDNRVWFLGNSLNALGDRASMILQVPDPEPVIKRLHELRQKAVPFQEYTKRRRATRARRGTGG
jgi:hypothetical protein